MRKEDRSTGHPETSSTSVASVNMENHKIEGTHMKIDSEDTDVESLLGSNYFAIPPFQRPYSWDDENIEQFWDDVTVHGDTDYFIGSMVVYEEDKRLNIVDGQQRLTTITLFLCSIRDALQEIGEFDLATGLHLFIERPNKNYKLQYVLLTDTSFPYLQDKIQRFGDPQLPDSHELPEEKSLRFAYAKLTTKLQTVVDSIELDATVAASQKADVKRERLLEIRDQLLALKLIFVRLDNEDDAYLIFETLNTRGKDLAVSDLVKNHLGRTLKSHGDVDAVKIRWAQMNSTLFDSSADLTPDTFLYHREASRYDAQTMKKLYTTMRKRITAKTADSELTSLVNDAGYYRSANEATYQWPVNEREAAQSIRAMQLFKLSQPMPMTLSLVRAYRENKIRYAKLRDALRAIEYFHFAFTAVTSSRSSGGISGMYASSARRLYEAPDSNSAALVITELIQKLRERRPPAEEFVVSFSQIVYTDAFTKQKGLVQYTLRKMAAFHNYSFPVSVDDLTIEHLHPQSLSGAQWDDSTIGQFGNLILVDAKTNELLGDRPFDEKRAILKECHSTIPPDVLESASISPEWVRDRTAAIGAVAYNDVWTF